jgi:hypothetical protein
MINKASYLENATFLVTDVIFEELLVLMEHPAMRPELCTRGTAFNLHWALLQFAATPETFNRPI